MVKLFVRIGGALGVTALALCFLGLIPFLSAGPTAGAGFVPGTPGFTVNREFKGDRLPIHAAFNSSAWQTEFGPQASDPRRARAGAPRNPVRLRCFLLPDFVAATGLCLRPLLVVAGNG